MPAWCLVGLCCDDEEVDYVVEVGCLCEVVGGGLAGDAECIAG